MAMNLEADASFDRLARVLRDSIRTPSALISVVEPDRQLIPGAVGLDPHVMEARQVPINESVCRFVVADAAPLIVSDLRCDPRLRLVEGIIDKGVVAYAGVPLRDAQDIVVGSVCAIDTVPREWTAEEVRILEDIAEVASAEFRLRHSADALARSYEQLTMFAGQISHDLKSPLGAILGFLDLASEDLEDFPQTRTPAYITRCQSSANRMVRTIDELLAYATVGGSLRLEEISLAAVMSAVTDDLSVAAADAEITFTDATVCADPVQLHCLLQNLVGNALKFRRHDVTPVVHVGADTFPTHIEIRISDNGPGIPAERREEVLRPLVRLRRDVPGSGLGLATCDRIVTAHGGILQVTGNVDGGTTIAIQLPRLGPLDQPLAPMHPLAALA